jgi:glycogen debranching enzyme
MPPVTTFIQELSINHGDTFLVTARDGQARVGRHGLYHRDIRYLARYHFTLNGAEPVLLTATNVDFHRSRAFFTNPTIGGYRTEIPQGQLIVTLVRAIEDEHLVEEWEIDNYGLEEARFSFALSFQCSFEDVFQVRGLRGPSGRIVFGRWDADRRALTYEYRNRDFERSLRIELTAGRDDVLRYSGDQIAVEKVLPPRGGWRVAVRHGFEVHGERETGTKIRTPSERAEQVRGPDVSGKRATSSPRDAHRSARDDGQHGLLPMPELHCADPDLMRMWRQAQADLTALHLRAVGGSWFPAAGVPWFTTLFGRDSLITGYQLVHGNSGPARAALLRLAELQADAHDPAREAEPGKMPHEVRDGELAHFDVPPQRPSYSTADASLLYAIVLHEVWRWTGDAALVRRLMPIAERCLEWAARFGDRDGDGLQEYMGSLADRRNWQMGWKDSQDAVVDEEGRIPDPPIAVVELQGYWADALRRTAELRERVMDQDGAELREQAERIRQKVEERFWMEDEGTYDFGLDGGKRPLRSVASNAGHLLWSGLPSAERARRTADRLLKEDMWSGWGIRTLSARNPGYNPISYHRGSVWPHDNSIVAHGFQRYGLTDAVERVVSGIVDAAVRFENASIPELWSGVDRRTADFPIPYLDANRPQAWAAGTPALLVRAVLGLECDPVARRLTVDPRVPERLGEIELRDMEVLGGWVSLRAKGDEFEVIELDAEAEVVRAAH